MFGGIIPRASDVAVKNAFLLTLHWCYEVYSRIFGDRMIAISLSKIYCEMTLFLKPACVALVCLFSNVFINTCKCHCVSTYIIFCKASVKCL